MNDYQEQKGISDFNTDAHGRLPCGCIGKCDPYAHDTAWDWDGRADGPDWSDLSLEERDQWVRDHPYCHECGDDLEADDIELGHRWCKVCAEKPAREEAEGEPLCPVCSGDGGYMGALGNRSWFRCQSCGLEFSREAE